MKGTSGQSLVELVAFAPVVILCGLLGLQALVAGANYVYADNAAHAGAVAAQLGHDGERAARDALPGWSRGRVRAVAGAGELVVTVRPRAIVPPLARFLEVRSRAAVLR